MMLQARRTFAALLAVSVLAACQPSEPTEQASESAGGPGVAVVATTAVLGDLVSGVVAGTGIALDVLMPAGADPHTYAPSAADGRRVREADLIVANGLGLEVVLDDLLVTAEGEGEAVLHLAEVADPLPYIGMDDEHGDHADESAEEHAAHDGGLDPHVWLDPDRVALMVEALGVAVAEVADEADAALVATNAAALAEQFRELGAELDALVAEVPSDRRALVTNHDALGYFADRFGFDVVATVLPGSSTQAELSAADFSELLETLEAAGVTVVFTEPTSSQRAAEALAEQLPQVLLVELYTGSIGPPGSGAETVAGMLRLTTERIVAALR